MFRLGMGTHANPQKIWLKASTRLHTVDKYCTGGYYKRLREQCPFWGCQDFMDADIPPLTKGMEVFLRFTYAPIPKQIDGFNRNIILTTTIIKGFKDSRGQGN